MNELVLTSLLELSNQGRSLPLLQSDNIHYPEFGARNLAQVEERHFWFVERPRLILKLLRRNLKSTTEQPIGIDVGCGPGFTSIWLSEIGIPTLGLDALRGFSAMQEQKRGKGSIQGDLFSAQLKPEFDFAMALDVLEHIRGDTGFTRKVTESIKPGGLFLISVPAFSWLWSGEDDAAGHLRRYNKEDLRRLETKELKLEYQTCFYFSILPLYIISRLFLKNKNSSGKSSEMNPNSLLNRIVKLLLQVELYFAVRWQIPLDGSIFWIFRKVAS